MKKFLLYLIIIMGFIIPSKVMAESYYFPYGDYYTTFDPITEKQDMEVNEIITDEGIMYQYRYRYFMELPYDIIISSDDFDLFDVLVTNIPRENIVVTWVYDLNDPTKREDIISIVYGEYAIYKAVVVDIPIEYINVDDEIVVKLGDQISFEDYIETNINNFNDIKILGDYNCDAVGEYDITISFKNIVKDIKLKVIDYNLDSNEDNTGDNPNSFDKTDKVEHNIINNDNKTIKNENSYYYDNKQYIENNYITNDKVVGKEDKLNSNYDASKVIYISKEEKQKDNDIVHCDKHNTFYYISYTFYSLVIILLSIIVVRKK